MHFFKERSDGGGDAKKRRSRGKRSRGKRNSGKTRSEKSVAFPFSFSFFLTSLSLTVTVSISFSLSFPLPLSLPLSAFLGFVPKRINPMGFFAFFKSYRHYAFLPLFSAPAPILYHKHYCHTMTRTDRC